MSVEGFSRSIDKPKRTPCTHPSEKYIGEEMGRFHVQVSLSGGSGDWRGRLAGFRNSDVLVCQTEVAFPCCIAVLHGVCIPGDDAIEVSPCTCRRPAVAANRKGLAIDLDHSAYFSAVISFRFSSESKIPLKLPIQALSAPLRPRSYSSPPRTYPGMLVLPAGINIPANAADSILGKRIMNNKKHALFSDFPLPAVLPRPPLLLSHTAPTPPSSDDISSHKPDPLRKATSTGEREARLSGSIR